MLDLFSICTINKLHFMKLLRNFISFILAFSTSSLLLTQYSFGSSIYPRVDKQTSSWLKFLVAELNWSWNSVPTFGHTFKKHGQGSSNTTSLKGTAGGTKTAQGQWLDNDAAAIFLKNLRPTISGPVTTPIPKGLGQVINPDGSIISATHAVAVPITGGGYRTAYPFVPGKPDYSADSEAVN
jgi:hypothetical protein